MRTRWYEPLAYAIVAGCLAFLVMMWAFKLYNALHPYSACSSDKALLYCQELLTKKVWSF